MFLHRGPPGDRRFTCTHFARLFLSCTRKIGDCPEAGRYVTVLVVSFYSLLSFTCSHWPQIPSAILQESTPVISHCTVSCVCSNQAPTLPRTGGIIRRPQSVRHLCGTIANVAATRITVSRNQAARNLLDLAQVLCFTERKVGPTETSDLLVPQSWAMVGRNC